VAQRVSHGGALQLVEGEARLLLRPLHRGRYPDGGQAARNPVDPADHLGDPSLGGVEPGELDEGEGGLGAGARAADNLPRLQQGVDARGHALGGGLKQVGREIDQVLPRVGGVPLLLEGLERVDQPGVETRRGVVREAQVDRDPVRRLEADPLDLARDPVGLPGEDLLRLARVALDQLDALAGRYPVRLQEDVELAFRALLVPGLLDRAGALLADPGHIAQAARLLAQDPEGSGPERVDDLVGVDLADARHEAAAEVLADPVDVGRELAPERGDLELRAVLGVAGPLPREVQRLPALHPGQRADDRHRLRAPLRLRNIRPELRDRVVVFLV
jgi:hypothetical protein